MAGSFSRFRFATAATLSFGAGVLFAALWLTAIRTEIRRRRVTTLRARLAQEA